MYYRLKDRYFLRGWDRLPYALVDSETGSVSFLNSQAMDALNLCNGKIDLSLPIIPETTRTAIHDAEKAGIVEPCEPGHALNPKQEYRLYPARYIRQAHWSITGKCNYKCRHCCMSAPDAKFGELSHDEIMSIVRQLGECGVMNVSLTGGEPLIRPDFMEIVDALLERDIHIGQIYSNGALVNERLLRELEARNIHPEFNMSFDGVGWHDWLRGINGAEEAVNRAFSLCREHGFPTGSEMCIHQGNKNTLRETVRHLGSLGVSSLKTNPVADLGIWHDNGYGESISTEELYNLYLDYIPQYYEDGMPLSIMLGGFFYASPKNPRHFSIPSCKPECDPKTFCLCGHARLIMYISPEGRTLPCLSLSGMKIQDEFPLITEKGLAQCITDSRYMRLIDTRASEYFAANDECRACKYSLCCYGGCRADALSADESNIMGKAPGCCEIFRGGWVERIIQAVKSAKPDAESEILGNKLFQEGENVQ